MVTQPDLSTPLHALSLALFPRLETWSKRLVLELPQPGLRCASQYLYVSNN